MPPNLRRFLPFILIAFFLLIVLPTIFRKTTTTGPTAATISQQTISAMTMVDRAEAAYKTSSGRYSSHVSDLLDLDHRLGAALLAGVSIQLDASSNGQGYIGQVASSVIALVRARQNGKVITSGCTVVKSSSGVACPGTAAATTTTATTTATTATTVTPTTTG